MPRRIDLTGQRFGRLVALKFTGDDKNRHRLWECRCDCGRTVNIDINSLRSGKSKSCGCSRKGINKTHGKSGTRLYGIWADMLQRTYNPDERCYANYGGRGITVCDEWMEFEAFYQWAIQNGYSEELTIDRIDNDKGYFPENCRWVTRKVQGNNKRSNRRLEYQGQTKTLEDWAILFGMKLGTVANRLNLGLSVEKALEIPVKEIGQRKMLEYQGETKPLGEWAELFKIKPATIHKRLSSGWTVEKALKTPVAKRKKYK